MTYGTFAQVPSQMEVAGVKLKITEGAKREIEETLDLLTRSQYHFQLKVDRSNLYLPIVERVLAKEGIPDDFKYLAIQEGEFISDAVSTSNAVGFWQFKKASAQELGLRIDEAVDERKHIIASTIGATKYLKRSNFVFDNWILALQSYLQGLGGTQRTIDEKYYGAKKLEINKKSHWYVKKFIAHKLAFQGFVGNGKKHPEVSLGEYLNSGNKTLKQISKEINVDYDELKRFNKWLKQSRIPDEKTYAVIYPVKNGSPLVRNREKPKDSTPTRPTPKSKKEEKEVTASSKPDRPKPKIRLANLIKPVKGNVGAFPRITGNLSNAYDPGQIRLNGIPAIRARDGESTQSLAQRCHLSASKLKLYNDIGAKGRVRGGQYYYLKNKKNKGKVHYHIVQPNETLWGISQQYGIKLKKLLQKNRMKQVEPLKIGRVLWLRFIRPTNAPIEYSNVIMPQETIEEDLLIEEIKLPKKEPEQTIEKPDTTEEVKTAASEPQEKEIETEAFNPASDPTPPIKLDIKELIAGEGDTIIVHEVQSKESFFAISKKYQIEIDDILSWNQLDIMDGLQIGQKLKLVVKKNSLSPSTQSEVITEDQALIHEVMQGETLWSISRKYKVTIEDLIKWNNKVTDSLSMGEKLRILKAK